MTIKVQPRALLKSLGLHALVAIGLLLLPAGPFRHPAEPEEVDVVFHRPPPPPIEIAAIPVSLPRAEVNVPGPRARPAAPARAAQREPTPVPGVPLADEPGLPEGLPEVPIAEPPKKDVGKSGILAFRDQIASVAEDKTTTRLGAAARLVAADDATPSSSTLLLSAGTGRSGGIDAASLSRHVGGGGGGTGGGGRMAGVSVGRATDSLAGIGGAGGPRALGGGGSGGESSARGGPGASRTDEEIQIVFDRNKASFYRLYLRELRNDPTLKGQMVLKLTIEPDGSVSMCMLQSSDMQAPELAAQVVDRVRAINFGAKDGVQALTIVYPIDFLPAA